MGGNHSRDNQRNSQPHQHVDPRHNTDVSRVSKRLRSLDLRSLEAKFLKIYLEHHPWFAYIGPP